MQSVRACDPVTPIVGKINPHYQHFREFVKAAAIFIADFEVKSGNVRASRFMSIPHVKLR